MYRVFSDWQNKCYLILVVLFPYCKKECPLLNMLIVFPARPSYLEQTCVFCSTEPSEGLFLRAYFTLALNQEAEKPDLFLSILPSAGFILPLRKLNNAYVIT